MTRYARQGDRPCVMTSRQRRRRVMLRGLKMYGMAVTDLIEQGAPAFDAAVLILSQLLKADGAFARPTTRPRRPASRPTRT